MRPRSVNVESDTKRTETDSSLQPCSLCCLTTMSPPSAKSLCALLPLPGSDPFLDAATGGRCAGCVPALTLRLASTRNASLTRSLTRSLFLPLLFPLSIASSSYREREWLFHSAKDGSAHGRDHHSDPETQSLSSNNYSVRSSASSGPCEGSSSSSGKEAIRQIGLISGE